LGGSLFDSLDSRTISSGFWASIVLALFWALVGVVYAILSGSDPSRAFVLIAVSVYLLLWNPSMFLNYLLQATNRVSTYSASISLGSLFSLIGIIALMIAHVYTFQAYVIVICLSSLVTFGYAARACRRKITARPLPLRESFDFAVSSIRVGLNLMIANICNILILGVGRLVIEGFWGLETFGRVSLAISIVTVVQLFITQVGMVLFPALRASGESSQKYAYELLRSFIDVALPCAYLAYLPIVIFLNYWLPNYHDSTIYLGILLPLLVFLGGVNLVSFSFFKVLRRERWILYLNVGAAVLSALACFLSALILHSIESVLFSLVLVAWLRYIVGEYLCAKLMQAHVGIGPYLQLSLAAVFTSAYIIFTPLYAWIIVLCAWLMYLIPLRKSVGMLKTAFPSLIQKSPG